MITSDPEHQRIVHEATLQLRNVFDVHLVQRYDRSRWLLTFGYFCLMAAALPLLGVNWFSSVLYFVGCAFGLAAARAAWRQSRSRSRKNNR